MTFDRRKFIRATGAAAGTSLLGFPAIVRSQSEPIRLGLLTIKTGALASGGIDMERGLTILLKEKSYTMGGRKVALTVADSGGVPAQARTKMQELVERDKVQAVVGPLAAFEALAMDDYIRSAQIPTLPIAGAEDMTQRKANPWFVRATSTSAQCAYPMADYCAKHLKYKRMTAIADDFAYGHEMLGGFQKVFEDAGGTLVQKLFSPLNAPDYGSYIAQIKPDVDGVFLGFAGAISPSKAAISASRLSSAAVSLAQLSLGEEAAAGHRSRRRPAPSSIKSPGEAAIGGLPGLRNEPRFGPSPARAGCRLWPVRVFQTNSMP